MRMRAKLSIVTLVGAGAILLCVLAAVIALRAQIVNASIRAPHGDAHPYVEVSLMYSTVVKGEYLDFGVLFHDMPCSNESDGCNYNDTFHPNLTYRYELLNSNNTVNESCISSSAVGADRTVGGHYVHWKTESPISYRIDESCPSGSYKIRITATYSGWNEDKTDVESFQVVDELPAPTPTSAHPPRLQPQPQQPTAAPTASPAVTPTKSNASQGGNRQSSQPGNNGGNRGNNDQGNVDLKSFISNLTPQPAYSPQQQSRTPIAVTVPEIMNVRSGPGLNHDIVTTVPAGTQGAIVGIDPNDDWYHVEIDGIEGQVWIYQDLTTLDGSLVGVKQYTAPEITQLTGGAPAADGSAPLAITQPLLLNARAGPGLTYDVLTTIPQGTWMKITGIDTLGEWYRVELDDLDQAAWIFRDYTKVASGSLSGLSRFASGGTPAADQLTGSITVELALPTAGGVDMEVSWVDVSGCAQLYNLYHRSSPDSTVYISLELAATPMTVNSKSLTFTTLSGSGFISAWCGTMAAGRKVAEVEIDPGVAGTYSSKTTSGGLAAVHDAEDGSR